MIEGLDLDPIKLQKFLWPDVYFWSKQREIIYSVVENRRTDVYAGNKQGKDFIAAFLALWRFLSSLKMGRTCRAMTTSVKEDHLTTLWGEIDRFISTSKHPLRSEDGGPLVVNHQHIRRLVNGKQEELSWLKGAVSKKGEGMSGHHAQDTMLIGDEASGIEDEVLTHAKGWCQRFLFIGNCWPCINFWFRDSETGDQPYEDRGGFYRKVIRIEGSDSPNVRLGLAEIAAGKTPSNRMIVPGVLPYREYADRLKFDDPVSICVGIHARFWKGAQQLWFPPEWLDKAERACQDVPKGIRRKAKGLGVDPAEGGDKTTMAAVDEHGLIELVGRKTPNTAEIIPEVIAFGKKHGLTDWSNCCFDRGGGGQQHVDRMREMGYPVRSIPFGESLLLQPKRGMRHFREKVENREQRYVYVNRRAQMYGELSMLLDPEFSEVPFAIPGRGSGPQYQELRHQLSVMPKLTDREGRYKMLPKNANDPNSKEKTLVQLIGHSPDESDAVVLAVFGMLHEAQIQTQPYIEMG